MTADAMVKVHRGAFFACSYHRTVQGVAVDLMPANEPPAQPGNAEIG